MNYGVVYFKIADKQKGQLKLTKLAKLTSSEAVLIRKEILDFLDTSFDSFYLDTKDVYEVDLSGINEIIQSNKLLSNKRRGFVLAYRQSSIMEKWVQATGLDSFIQTAILPKQ